ncbi:MAG TPA: hypothetical protein VF516_41750 [Kofleriaceae bacterium]
MQLALASCDQSICGVIIQKTYPSPSGGEPQVMEAIVYVDPSGKVTLASYGAAKAMPPGKPGAP